MERESDLADGSLPNQFDIDRPGEACGLVGYYNPNTGESGSPDREGVKKALLGLWGVQHRGQSGSGMSVFNKDGEIFIVKDDGLVDQVMGKNEKLALHYNADKPAIIAHARYSTSGKDSEQGDHYLAQPFEAPSRKFALGHNGHIEFIGEIAETLGYDVSEAESDSQALTYLLDQVCEKEQCDLVESLGIVMPHIDGAATLILNEPDRLIGVRDLRGYRPLVIGTTGEGEYVFTSETVALDMMGAEYLRDVEPGEIVSADIDGLHSKKIDGEVDERNCLFETIYVDNRNSIVKGKNVALTREALGRESAKLFPVEADLIVPVLNSGDDYAEGYAQAIGIPKKKAITKNDYVNRTFIKDNQLSREEAVRLKHLPNREMIEGKRVVLIDDSIVRGTTMKVLVDLVREAGATEVHIRIPSPPYVDPCFYGMDTRDVSQLTAHGQTKEEVRQFIGADTLDFLPLENALEVIEGRSSDDQLTKVGKFCTACMSGVYHSGAPAEFLQKKPA